MPHRQRPDRHVFPDEDSADPLAGLVGLSDLKLQSGGFNIEGEGVFTQEGGIVRLALPRFSIQDKADIALQLVNDSGNLDIDIKGAFAAAAHRLAGKGEGAFGFGVHQSLGDDLPVTELIQQIFGA